MFCKAGAVLCRLRSLGARDAAPRGSRDPERNPDQPSGARFPAEQIPRGHEARAMKPGKAVDIGAGLDATHCSSRRKGGMTKQATKRGLKLRALAGDADSFNYGQRRWYLVVGTFQHGMVARNAQKIIESPKPGGIVSVEGSTGTSRRTLEVETSGTHERNAASFRTPPATSIRRHESGGRLGPKRTARPQSYDCRP